MRLIGSLSLVVLVSCFSPNKASSDGDDTTGSTTEPSTTSTTSTTTTTQTTSPSTSTSTSGTDTTNGSTTAIDTESSGSTSDTGPGPGCEGFDGRVVYVNLDGVELTMGIVDNAPANITSNASMVGIWPGYTTDDADEVYALVEGHYQPYDVCLTRDTPQVPDYTMIVVSSETFQDPNFVGFGVADCGDAVQNSVNVVVVSEEAGIATPTKAIAVSKHIAHTFGLNSAVAAPSDIMNQYVGNTLNGATFTDDCFSTVTQTCDAAVTCGAGEQQSNPYLEMLLGV